MKGQRGLTLVETMIVSAIIAVLATIGIYSHQVIKGNTDTNICLNNQRTLYQLASLYALETGTPFSDSVFSSITSLREALCPGGDDPTGYIKNWEMFECPSSRDGSYDDYSIVWEGDTLMGFSCNIVQSHNVSGPSVEEEEAEAGETPEEPANPWLIFWRRLRDRLRRLFGG